MSFININEHFRVCLFSSRRMCCASTHLKEISLLVLYSWLVIRFWQQLYYRMLGIGCDASFIVFRCLKTSCDIFNAPRHF